MKKNSFSMVALLSTVVLLGVNFEVRSSEDNKAIGAFVGATVLMTAAVLAVTNTGTYQTYSDHKARLAQEKQESDYPFFNAQVFSGKSQSGQPMEERIAAYEKSCQQQRQEYYTKSLPVIKSLNPSFKILDDYRNEKV